MLKKSAMSQDRIESEISPCPNGSIYESKGTQNLSSHQDTHIE